MRRLRLLFVAFSVALFAPLAFLVHRALESVALERTMRHQVVAERIFDEMERGLSRLLDAEEERPFEQWGEGVPAAEFPFVVAHFQVEPEGEIRLLSVDPEQQGSRADLENNIRFQWRVGREKKSAPNAAPEQIPGTTLGLVENEGPAAAAEPAPRARKNQADDEVSAFDALRSLNKAVEERVARQRKAAEYDEGNDRPKEAPREERLFAAPPPAAASRFAGAPGREMRDAAGEEIDLPPLRGRVADDGRLLLQRTVVRDAKVYRQGVLLDVQRLGGWLREQALGSAGVASFAEVSFATRLAPLAADGDREFVYQHRFAEPFDDLNARLALRPLPGVGGVAYVYALSALLLATGSLGLASLYRMVATVVGFAERRSNFVAAVTHELKTPLTAIRMYGEMLRDGMVPSEAKRDEYYRHITQESERLSRLINNVLEFSRLEKGNRDVAVAAGAVAPVVREVAEILRPHVEGQGFTLRVDTDGELPPVRFERDALVQMLCNLVDNAVKYAGEASRKEILLRCRSEDGHVTVAVRDHGPGVAARHLGMIFEPFYRGESELTRRSKGVGLGLALVRGLAERMGARVRGRNVPGGGFEVEVAFN
jgi:signal transduction histidine kinase